MVKNPSSKLEIQIHLLSLIPMRFRVMVRGILDSGSTVLHLEALTVGNGVTVTDIELLEGGVRPHAFTPTDTHIPVPFSPFELSYTVQSQYQTCVGADRRVYFTYPFANENEFFIGTGVLPYPISLPKEADGWGIKIALTGLPAGWQTFGNELLTNPHPAHLDGFFLYAALLRPPVLHRYQGQGQAVTVHLLVQRGRTSPLSFASITTFLDETLAWLEQHLAPYRQAPTLNILFLQAAADFETQTNRLAFATGENVLNGIVTYAPNDVAYLERLFGESDYAVFLLDGLAHELVHSYTTTAWQGRYKAMLYPALDCPPAVAHLLGEALAGYLHRFYMRQRPDQTNVFEFPPEFVSSDVARALEQQKKRGRNHPFLDLFLFDQELHRHGCSLLALLGAILREREGTPLPYAGVDFLLERLETQWGISLGERGRVLLLPDATPDYEALLGSLS